MKGYDVTFELEGAITEVSRRLILPERLMFNELAKIVSITFSFDGTGFSEFSIEGSEIYADRRMLIDEHIKKHMYYDFSWRNSVFYYRWFNEMLSAPVLDQFLYDDLDKEDDWRVNIIFNRKVEYDRNYPTLISYECEFCPIANNGGINCFNNMIIKGMALPKFRQDFIQDELAKIYSTRYAAYMVRIRCERKRKNIWRDFLIPERTTILELKKIIIISFDVDEVSFGMKDDELADEYLRKRYRIYSSDGSISIESEGSIFLHAPYPILNDYGGGYVRLCCGMNIIHIK